MSLPQVEALEVLAEELRIERNRWHAQPRALGGRGGGRARPATEGVALNTSASYRELMIRAARIAFLAAFMGLTPAHASEPPLALPHLPKLVMVQRGDDITFKVPQRISSAVVGEPELIWVTLLDDHTVHIFGRERGQTSITFLDLNGRVIGESTVNVILQTDAAYRSTIHTRTAPDVQSWNAISEVLSYSDRPTAS